MNADITLVAMGIVVLAINCATMIMTFPGKRSTAFTVTALVLFTLVFYAVLYSMDMVVPEAGGLPGLIYLPVMVLLFEGKLFHKVFAYFLQFLLTAFQVALAQTVSGNFAHYGGDVSTVVLVAVLAILFTAYLFLMFKYGKHLFNRIFVYGRSKEWAVYSFGAIFAFAVLTTTQIAPGSSWHIVFMLFFILWSFGVLCFAIINANEKARHKYEAEFARDIISSGSEHFRKMDEMYDTLRILRHDYKYHLDTISELLSTGNKDEAENYLIETKAQIIENELTSFCRNSVINALISSYAERSTKLNIRFITQISIPDDTIIPNYEMCIVLGNLLENAVEACETAEDIRRIELVINTQGANIAVMVKNSYAGRITQNNDYPLSKKKDGGLGLRSVQAVATHHGGELMTEWDDTMFSAYVLMRVQ